MPATGLPKQTIITGSGVSEKPVLKTFPRIQPVQQIVPVEPRLLKPEENHSGDPGAGLDIRIKGCSIHVTEETSLQLLAAVLEVVRGAD